MIIFRYFNSRPKLFESVYEKMLPDLRRIKNIDSRFQNNYNRLKNNQDRLCESLPYVWNFQIGKRCF